MTRADRSFDAISICYDDCRSLCKAFQVSRLPARALHSTHDMSLQPIITICGTTGVGKSKLAIDLALHINRHCKKSGWRAAKVINADAMQVYKGLDIITNKLPESEREGIPHLLMGFKHPSEQYMVGEWVQDAIKLVRLSATLETPMNKLNS